MDPERWKSINRIFHAALECSSSERAEFVAKASGGDRDLQAEVDLLLEADASAGSYIEAPLVPFEMLSGSKAGLDPGETLCGRFRIVRAVGEGGMGHVFEAFDTELGVHVALKVIRPEIASHPEALARFRQEARLARRITHTNVCRTFDLARWTRVKDSERGATQEIVFLTMEFLEGETLASRINRSGTLPLDEALNLARQIASGLRAAQDLSVVHRDIKPANIMLVPWDSAQHLQLRAVITDFGLARANMGNSPGNVSSFSNKANPIGTLAYMAPEQLQGLDLTPATDIYAFGLVLFEMVTGNRAFPSDNLLSGITQRLSGTPPNPKKFAPDLPESWCRAIEGCLRPSPTERFSSPLDVIAVLEGSCNERRARTEAQTRPLANRAYRWIPRRLPAKAVIVVAVLALFVAGLRYLKLRADSKVSPGALVYLTPVRNETNEKTLDNLTELMHAGLSQSAQINLLDQDHVGDTLQRMSKPPETVIDAPIAREIAMRTGAVRVVFATVRQAGHEFQLDLDVQQPDNTPVRYREHWSRTFTWKTAVTKDAIPSDLLTAVRNASDWIRKQVGESDNDIVHLDVPPQDATTGSWEALLALERALNLQSQLKTEPAVLELQKAVQLDPQFALAYGRLGDLQVSTGAIADGLRSYEHALDLTELSRLDLRERDRIRGLAAADSGDFETAAIAFRDYAVNYDHDYLGWFYLGYPLIMLGRKEEGIADLRHSYELNPQEVSPAAQLAMFDAATGNYGEAIELAKHLRTLGYPGYGVYALGLAAFLQGNYEEARKQFTALQGEQDPPGSTKGTMMLAHLAAEQGQYPLSVQLLTEGIEMDRREGSLIEEAVKLIDRASVEAKLGRLPEMLNDIQAALSLDKSPPRINSASLIMGRALSTAPPAMKARIRRALNDLDQGYAGDELGMYSKLAKLRVHAQALWANGDREGALDTGRRANAIDAPVSDRSYWAFLLFDAAEHEQNAERRRELLEEAYDAAARTVLNPGLAWKDANRNLPGFLADEMGIFLELSSRLGRKNQDVEKVQRALQALNRGPAKSAL
jgi:tetratricopeptide (TPR) repeat protein